MNVKSTTGKVFEAYQWLGPDDPDRPEWLKKNEVVLSPFYGPVLMVDVYMVRPNRWILRGEERGDIFPVPEDMFATTYTQVGAEL